MPRSLQRGLIPYSCRQRDLSISGPPLSSPLKQSFSVSDAQALVSSRNAPPIPFSSQSRLPTSPPPSPFAAPYGYNLAQSDRDIIPRASPTISRPRSYFGADPFALPTPQHLPPRRYIPFQPPLQLSRRRGKETFLNRPRQSPRIKQCPRTQQGLQTP